MTSADRILVVRAGALGDTLMVTPLLRALGSRHPHSRLDVLCARGAAPVLELWPTIGDLFMLRFRNLPFALSPEKHRLVRRLRARRYSFAVLLERAPRYRALLERAGLPEIRSFRETPFDPGSHAVANNLRAAGFDERESSLEMEIFLAPEDRARAAELLAELPHPRIGIHVGYGPARKKRNQAERLKGWPLSRWMELARGLSARGGSLLFTGSREDRRDVDAVVSALPPSGRVANLAGRTSVRELAALIEGLDLFVSVDSGPAHLAAAVKTPLVVLWGPAILEQVRPFSQASQVAVLRHPPPCAPCYDTPWMKTCRRNVCMESIAPEEVLAQARATIEL